MRSPASSALDPVEVRRVNMLRGQRPALYRWRPGEVLEDVTPRGDLERGGGGARLSRAFRERQAAERAARALSRRRPVLRRRIHHLRLAPSTRPRAFPAPAMRRPGCKIEPSGAVNASVGLMALGAGLRDRLCAGGRRSRSASIRTRCAFSSAIPISRLTAWAAAARAAARPAAACSMSAAQTLRDKVLAIAAALLGLNSQRRVAASAPRASSARLGGEWTDDRADARACRAHRLSRSVAAAAGDGAGPRGAPAPTIRRR